MGPGYEFANETDGIETYTEGTVAMANADLAPTVQGLSRSGRFHQPRQDPQLHDLRQDEQASRDVVASMAEEGQDGSNPDGTGRPNNPLRSRELQEPDHADKSLITPAEAPRTVNSIRRVGED